MLSLMDRSGYNLTALARTTKKTTIHRGRSMRSLSKEIMRNCYAKVGVTSSARNMTALSKFKSEIDKRLIKESTKQPTNTGKPLATPAYRFIVRSSLFPNPKHCNFFSPAWAQILNYLPTTKIEEFAEKFSLRFTPSTAMVMQATDPPNQPDQPNRLQRSDPVITMTRNPGRPPKYGKTSSTGLYIKYNPGSTICSLQKFMAHVRTNEHATTGNTTALKQTVLYSNSQTSTVRTSETLGKTDRQKFYYGFRKPPPESTFRLVQYTLQHHHTAIHSESTVQQTVLKERWALHCAENTMTHSEGLHRYATNLVVVSPSLSRSSPCRVTRQDFKN